MDLTVDDAVLIFVHCFIAMIRLYIHCEIEFSRPNWINRACDANDDADQDQIEVE